VATLGMWLRRRTDNTWLPTEVASVQLAVELLPGHVRSDEIAIDVGNQLQRVP
jgi:hypothetical protein